MNKRIFFYIKSNYRERQWDTIEAIKNEYKVIVPKNQQQKSNISIYAKSKIFYSKIKTFIANKLPLINFKILQSDHKKADIIYLWGSVPLNSKKPFIIEFDNPYVCTFYNYSAFLKYKNILKNFYDKAYKLTFISQTAKNHFLFEFNNIYENKSFVNYPFLKRNYKNRKNDKKEISFIFSAFNFKEKGGYELLEAFQKIKEKRIKLYIFSYVPKETKEKIKDERIIIQEPIPRKKLLEILPEMDVFILPTFYESFGMVLLEALSSGCGLIATNIYAIPEIIEPNKNGILLNHPFLASEKINNFEFVKCVKYRAENFYKNFILKEFFFYSLYLQLKEAIEKAIYEYQNWQKESINIYEKKFSEEIWSINFKKIIE
jgi:glycosyltransferase involved in cell wall biosynthesis